MPFNVRTIFLLIRGIDQSGRALSDASKATDNLAEKEKNLASASFRMLFAGAAFLAFGAMATGALLSTLSASTRGQRALDDFGKVVERVKKAFAEATINLFGEQIKDTIAQLNILSKDVATMKLLTEVGWTVAIGSVIVGIAAIAAAGIAFIATSVLKAIGLGALGPVAVTSVVATGLQIAIPIVIALVIGWVVKDYLKEQGIFDADKFLDETNKDLSKTGTVDLYKHMLGANSSGGSNTVPGTNIPSGTIGSGYGNYGNSAPSEQTFNFFGGINTKATKEELAPLFSDLMRDYIISKQGK